MNDVMMIVFLLAFSVLFLPLDYTFLLRGMMKFHEIAEFFLSSFFSPNASCLSAVCVDTVVLLK